RLRRPRTEQVETSRCDGTGRQALEGDVVLAAGPYPRLLEVGGVSGSVGLRLEAVAIAGAVAGAEELDRVGDDLHRPALAPVLGFPLAPVEPALDRYRSALGEGCGAVLALRTPDGDAAVVGLGEPLAGPAALAAAAGGALGALAAGGATTGDLGSTRKIRNRSTPSAIFRLWSSWSSSSGAASNRSQR